jgi:Calcineurin-like phosphoesterase
MAAKIDRMENEQRSKKELSDESVSLSSEDVMRRRHDIQAISHVITDKGRAQQKMGTRGSVCTANVLEALPDIKRTREQLLGERFLRVFQNPTEFIGYLSSEEFGNDLAIVCQAVGEIFENEPRCVFLQSPVYVFGDIHGNLEDLHFFADNIWKLGMDLTAGKFLFLGDYVDRGLSSLECVAYLFGLKLLYPSKIHLLRGNHETRDVSGLTYLLVNCILGSSLLIWILFFPNTDRSFDSSSDFSFSGQWMGGALPREVFSIPVQAAIRPRAGELIYAVSID